MGYCPSPKNILKNNGFSRLLRGSALPTGEW
jgi:hypothetical protein